MHVLLAVSDVVQVRLLACLFGCLLARLIACLLARARRPSLVAPPRRCTMETCAETYLLIQGFSVGLTQQSAAVSCADPLGSMTTGTVVLLAL